MISVIKLKAQVDNRDLPVLTNDGDITNYYVGQYKINYQNQGILLLHNKWKQFELLLKMVLIKDG